MHNIQKTSVHYIWIKLKFLKLNTNKDYLRKHSINYGSSPNQMIIYFEPRAIRFVYYQQPTAKHNIFIFKEEFCPLRWYPYSKNSPPTVEHSYKWQATEAGKRQNNPLTLKSLDGEV